MPIGTDVPHHRLTQESFLKMFDGGVVHNRDGKAFECDRFLFIGMGAFAQMRVPSAEPRTVGFCAAQKPAEGPSTGEITRELITAVCGSEQFMGRMVAVLHFQKLGKEQYKTMLKNAVNEVRQMYGSWELIRVTLAVTLMLAMKLLNSGMRLSELLLQQLHALLKAKKHLHVEFVALLILK